MDAKLNQLTHNFGCFKAVLIRNDFALRLNRKDLYYYDASSRSHCRSRSRSLYSSLRSEQCCSFSPEVWPELWLRLVLRLLLGLLYTLSDTRHALGCCNYEKS
ncbi:uncharacterized protein LOC133730768 [Rosa rugosa]|uniref:uncharacterized protein LOC133730768 n=1 Tax=Rosa rugosa TaxID=74645 RepID=UPI002B409013|nr:uncharacterized protein LOC133730768 [Rosa rugosa]